MSVAPPGTTTQVPVDTDRKSLLLSAWAAVVVAMRTLIAATAVTSQFLGFTASVPCLALAEAATIMIDS